MKFRAREVVKPKKTPVVLFEENEAVTYTDCIRKWGHASTQLILADLAANRTNHFRVGLHCYELFV